MKIPGLFQVLKLRNSTATTATTTTTTITTITTITSITTTTTTTTTWHHWREPGGGPCENRRYLLSLKAEI